MVSRFHVCVVACGCWLVRNVTARQCTAYVALHEVYVSRFRSHGGFVLMVTSLFAVGFMSHDMESIVDHAGAVMGAAEIVTSWRISAIDRMYQVESVIALRRYTGRTLGAGMLWRGKIKKRQF